MAQLEDSVIIGFMRRCGYLANDAEMDEVMVSELEMFKTFTKCVQVKANEDFLEWLNKHGTQVQVDLFKQGG
jgi:hypothetical protein